MNERIYRISSLNRFKDAIDKQALGFVTYDTWEDFNEGYVLRAVRSKDGQQRILTALMKLGMDRPTSQLTIEILDSMCHCMHLQSWSLADDNDAMWKLYAPDGNGVQICTSISKVEQLVDVVSLKVEYQTMSLYDQLKRITKGQEYAGSKAVKVDMAQVFATKTPAFEHEREVRLMTGLDTSLVKFNHQRKPNEFHPLDIRELVLKLISNGELKPGDMGTVMRQFNPNWLKNISFSHVPNFIESVAVSPVASRELVEEVEKICSANGIEFRGKSPLYTYTDVT